MDKVSTNASIHLARSVLATVERRLEQLAIDNSYWDQAVDNLVTAPDLAWADSNVGIYLYEQHGTSSSHVFGADNRLVYGMKDGERRSDDPFSHFSNGLGILLDRTRAAPDTQVPKHTSGLLVSGDTVAIVSASVLTTYFTVDGVEVNKPTQSVLMLTRVLDTDLIAELAENFLLKALRIQPPDTLPDTASIPLVAVDGTRIGYLAWQADTPGTSLLWWLLPLVAGVFIVLGGLVIVFVRQTRKTVTALQTAKEAHQQAKEVAEYANRTKSEFLATMSHEVRTPITGIMGFADMLLGDDLTKVSKEKVYRIKDATRSLLTIINDILDMSKLEAGKMEIENIDFHLPSMINDVLALFGEKRKGKRGKGLKLETTLADDFPDSVNCDPIRLRQVLVNLIGNAVKFTKEGSVTVEGTLCQSDDGKDFLRIAIHDTGIGMTPESIAKLFSDFTQADASITRRFEGTGLGLSICKRLIEMMGGEIGIESEVGKGSTFWFTLPYVAATSEVSEISQAASATVTHYQANRPLNILIAEDNRLNQQIVMATVEAFGHETELAENGAEAVEAHERGNFDLIIMDVRMPEMSGPDATKMIRRMGGDKSKIPIIALTADAMVEHMKGYFEAGMDDCVTKPIDRAELMEAINKVMGEEIHIPVETEVEETKSAVMEAPPDTDQDVSPEEPSANVDDFLKQQQAVADGLDKYTS